MAIYELTEFASYVQSDVDTATAQLLLTLVTGLISEIDGKDYDDNTTVVTASAKAIALEAAARAYRNPKGIVEKMEAITDFSETERWKADELGVFLTDTERVRLTPASARPRVGSIQLGTPW